MPNVFGVRTAKKAISISSAEGACANLTKNIHTVEDWLGKDNELGIDIWKRKYRRGDESFDDWMNRISGGDQAVAALILDKKFLFGGRILSNRGVELSEEKASLSNCYVLEPPEDSIESIWECRKAMARTYSYGGGCGIDISKLAPEGAKVHNQAKSSSGAVSFVDGFSKTTEEIGQNGRRGALMVSIDCKHPDVAKFITLKSDLDKVTSANISVRVSDDFMEAVRDDRPWELSFTRKETGETISENVRAKDLFRLMCHNNWDFAEPGILFWDRITGWNLVSEDPNFHLAGTNPCVSPETMILTDNGYRRIDECSGMQVRVWNGFEFSEVTPHVTGENQPMKIVKFSNGSELKCTLYHKFILADGSRVEAKDLVPGDRLAPHAWPVIPGLSFSNEFVTVDSIEDGGICEKVYCFNEPKNHSGIFNGVMTAQCAEEPLQANSCCLLGSLNLAAFVLEDGKFDFDSFYAAVWVAVKALNTALDEGIEKHPLKAQREMARDWRAIGLGVMGIADMLIKMGMRYGSEEANAECGCIAATLANESIRASAYLAGQYGPYPKYSDAVLKSPFFIANASAPTVADVQRNGLRNSQLLTIAPTGTLSTMIGVSGGIEPIFASSYTRMTKSLHGHDQAYKVYTPIFQQYMDAHGIKEEADLPDYFITSPQIPYKNRIAMQSVWQAHIDAAISSTVNLPNSATVEDVEQLYMDAWEANLKGITIYRAGCKREGILTTGPETPKPVKENSITRELPRGTILEADNNAIGRRRKLTTGCGSLYLLAYFDPVNGNLMETYLAKGSTGGCINTLTGLSRMISLAARGGVPLPIIVDQLESTGACPSYATRRAVCGDTSPGACCPMAVGRALTEMWNEVQADITPAEVAEDDPADDETAKPGLKLSAPLPEPVKDKDITVPDNTAGAKCPQCGEPLVFEGGCCTCKSCGYSKCE